MPVSKIYPKQSESVEENGEPGKREEEDSSLRKAFLPMIVSMRFFGLYFKKADSGAGKEYYSRIYCIVILIVLWFNAARIFTVFTSDDSFATGLLAKGTITATMIMTAIIGISCYRTSASGKLETLLKSFSKELSRRQFKRIRIRVIVWVVIAWVCILANTISSVYQAYFGEYRHYVVWMAPFTTMFPVVDRLAIIILATVFLICQIYVAAACFVPLIWNFLISSLFRDEFDACSKKFSTDLREAKISAEDTFETLRLKHQTLCQMVEGIDKYMNLTNAVYFVGLICIVILELYAYIAITEKANVPLFLGVSHAWAICCLLGLFLFAYEGIIVNHAAHEMYERIHDIDLTNLSAETIGQIIVFLNRLCGEPIGFTVLKIFVIDRNTILTILGLFITYFLLLIQLAGTSDSYFKLPGWASAQNFSNVTNTSHFNGRYFTSATTII